MSNYTRIYLEGFSYYLTIVTQNRQPILIENIELLRESFRRTNKRYEYSIEAIVILPDHIHMIIRPKIPTEYSKIVTYIKRDFLYQLNNHLKEEAKRNLTASTYNRQHSGIWQRRFYEHTIRDEKDFLKIAEYIRTNPIKHGLIENINDWKYSSFYKHP